MIPTGPRGFSVPWADTSPVPDTLEELAAYRNRLRSYSSEELEDIYYNIHVLRHPLRYRLVLMELERRRLFAAAPSPSPSRPFNLLEAAQRIPALARRPLWLKMLAAAAYFGISFAGTVALIAPAWLCAVPFRLRGVQAALVYAVWLPLGPAAAVRFAQRLGACRPFLAAAIAGAAAAFAWWASWGALGTIVASLGESGGAGGSLIGF